MSELKNISLKVFALIMDIILLGYKIIKQLSLPNRRKKGNILSSLFIFFIGIIERLNFFEHGIFSMAAIVRKKYIKQTIFIIGFILFLLSLFEWTADQRLSNKAEIASTEQLHSNVVSIIKKAKVLCCSRQLNSDKEQLEFHTSFHNSFAYSLPIKRFLFIRSLRI
jgi:hypothetical protein